MSDLIIAEHKIWREDLIRELFLERDVDQVLKIPISQTGLMDSRI